jgi:dienelactone hydrolase
MIYKEKVSFDVSGITCRGYIYRPPHQSPVQPCLILAHGFSGVQDTPSFQHTAQKFAEAGMLVLTFDYRHFGESEGIPRQLITIHKQLEDIEAAIRFARTQTYIDPKRIALWGTSLGGGHVVSVAAEDSHIAAVVAQIPFNGFPKKAEGRSLSAMLRLLRAMIKDAIRGRLGLSPAYIPAVGNSGELAVMSSPRAHQTIKGMKSKSWRNEVAQGFFLR